MQQGVGATPEDERRDDVAGSGGVIVQAAQQSIALQLQTELLDRLPPSRVERSLALVHPAAPRRAPPPPRPPARRPAPTGPQGPEGGAPAGSGGWPVPQPSRRCSR